MDKRLLLALALTVAIVFIIPRLFPTPPPSRTPAARTAGTPVDTSRAERPPAAPAAADTPATPTVAAADTTGSAAPAPAGVADTVVVSTPMVNYQFSTLGAMPIGAELREYRDLSPRDGTLQLARSGVPLLNYRLLIDRDTIPLDRVPFMVDSSALGRASGTAPLTFRASVGGVGVTISYTFAPDSYLVRVGGEVQGGASDNRYLILTLPRGLRTGEADSLDDQRNLAYVLKPTRDDARSVGFASLEDDGVAQRRVENGPFTWVASKSKYFLIALLADTGSQPFTGALLTGAPKTGRQATTADAAVVYPLGGDGRFAFELYTGPQEWRRLVALGRELQNANPYGWAPLRGFVQPFATIVMRILLWMHDTVRLSYGWVLVIFGIGVRLILWPLNQKAMRSSLKMQRVQPQLQEVQRRYRDDPEKQRVEMMKVYKEHNMSPFSMFSGCLPMLLPMPVLFALFFVFQNTIEFRGVSFLWLPDISLKDPYYIIPIVMGVSMFALSWIGLRSSPPNPQAKTMAYVMPVMFTVLFLNFASGLNLYYAVQNIAALPQQWLIARERAKARPPTQR
jgi:YidC/Oxa1 family membrane protein insertase